MDVARRLAATFASEHPETAAHRLDSVDPASTAAFLTGACAETAPTLIGLMHPDRAAAVLIEIGDDVATTILAELPVERSILIMRHLPQHARNSIVAKLPSPLATQLRQRLRFPPGTAGAVAEFPAPAAATDLAAGTAQQLPVMTGCPYLYTVDRDHHLVGVVHRRDLTTAAPGTPLASIGHSDPIRISAWTRIADLRHHHAWHEHDVLPVVDGKDTLIGVIRHKRLRGLQTRSPVRVDAVQPLDGFLDIAELYWATLAGAVEILAGSATGSRKGASRDD